jgi:ubiquinone/menaquinone biosynthesis C-methylase UbiE
VLDIACGTGYHTVNLYLNGFVVTGSDGSANMVEKANENAARSGLKNQRLVEAQWTSLSAAFPNEKFDAIICLGNAFTHPTTGDRPWGRSTGCSITAAWL